MSKPSIPKGTRDFLPEQAAKRAYLFSTIQNVFKLYGYLPIETPAVENLNTLMGKYGEEGDRLIFKILNSGDYLAKVDETILAEKNSKKATNSLSEKALRYDLTVPFARFVVQHQNELSFPFKRYQMQPVWRADRPQKGRYREFYQCDVDVVGSNSLWNEVELIQIVHQVFKQLKVDNTTIKLNNRKILAAIAEVIGEQDKLVDITVAIDKLDKIGLENVKKELLGKGIAQTVIDKLEPLFSITGDTATRLEKVAEFVASSEIGVKGIAELETVFTSLEKINITNVEFDITLARGLNYYTGAIIEVVTEGFSGSICGGGRYDDLTSIFGLKDVSGVGISFGADRIYDVMLQRDLFPESASANTKVLFVNFGESEAAYCLALANSLRQANIHTELYPDAAKMKKQMKYADDKQVPYVVMVGSDEMQSGELTVKEMATGHQEKLTVEQLIEKISA